MKRTRRMRTRFVWFASDAYLRAVQALEDLASEGHDAVERAAAEVLSNLREKRFRQAGLKRMTNPCLHKLLGAKVCRNEQRLSDQARDHDAREMPCDLPGADHTRMWRSNETNKPWAYISEPYGHDTTWEGLQELVDFCRKHGLRADLNPVLATHFPGRTTAILIRRDEGQKESSPIQDNNEHRLILMLRKEWAYKEIER